MLLLLLRLGSAADGSDAALVTCRLSLAGGAVWPAAAPATVRLRPRGTGPPSSIPCPRAICAFTDVAPGPYDVAVELPGQAPASGEIDVGPGERVLLEAILAPEGGVSLLRVADRSRPAQATTFDKNRLRELPHSRDPWSLVETAETNVVADRIDGGGLYLGEAGRLSSQGASWSQTRFELDGLEITDPEGTGAPLLRPDLEAFDDVDVATAAPPPGTGSPGTVLSLTPHDAGDRWRATLRLASLLKASPAEATPPPVARLDSWRGASLSAGGPLGKRWRLQITGSFLDSRRREAYATTDARSRLAFLLAQLTGPPSPESELRVLAAFQGARVPFPGRARFGETGLRETDTFGHLQASWRHRTGATTWTLAGGRSLGRFDPESGKLPGTIERLRDGPVEELALPVHSRRERWDVKGGVSLPRWETALGAHCPAFGFALARLLSTSEPGPAIPATAERVGDFPARVWEYAFAGSPSRRSASEIVAYGADRIFLGSRLSLEVGGRLARTTGSAQGALTTIGWLSLDPRALARLRLAGGLALFGAFGRYSHRLPLRVLSFGDPAAPVAGVYAWSDANNDGRFQEDERGPLVARTGPGAPVSSLDGGLRPPRTDEWILGIEGRYRSFLSARLVGIARKERRLIGSVDLGAPASDYTVLFVPDAGGNVVSPSDDRPLPFYDRSPASFGQDRYLLTNVSGHTTHFESLELSLEARLRRLDLLLGGTAHRSAGSGAYRGFRAQENDQGLPGELFDDPNASTFSRGRLFSDRAYTLRIAGSLRLEPDLSLGAVARYQDGQPFARVVIARDLAQGPEAVQAIPRGRSRFSYTLTVDARAEKGIRLGRGRAAAVLEVFNLLGAHNEVEEDVVTGPGFRRPTLSQPGRTWRGEIRMDF